MKNGWTGGQYSLFRAVLGLYLIFYYLGDLSFLPTLEGFFAIGGVISGALLLIGKRDRIAALMLIALLLGRLIVVGLDPQTVALLALVIFHAFLPKTPYGSWDAMSRTDPRGEWRLPQRYYAAKWVIMWLLYWWWAFWPGNPTGGVYAFLGVVAFGILALGSHVRPYIWLAMWISQLVLHALGDPNGVLLLAHWALFDPAWIKPSRRGHDYILFYDGSCGLCSHFVRFVLAERPPGHQMTFAPLQGKTAATLLKDNRGDTVILYHAGKTLIEWKAIAEVLQELGGLWRLGGLFVKYLPPALYHQVASHRHKLTGKHCVIIPSAYKDCFLP